MYVLDLGWVRVYSGCIIQATEELDTWGTNVAFAKIEDQAVSASNLHEVMQMPVMLLNRSSEHCHVVRDSQSTWTLLEYHIHLLLEDILGDLEPEWQSPESIPTERRVEGCQKTGFVIQYYAPVPMTCVKLAEYLRATELMSYLLEGWSLVISTFGGSVQGLRIKAYPQTTIVLSAERQ